MNLKYYVKIKLRCMKETKEFVFEHPYQLSKFIEREGQQGYIFVVECR